MTRQHIPDHARAALQHLSEKFKARGGQPDTGWATRLVDRYRRGETVAQLPLEMACTALRIPFPPARNHHGND
jgi:hypothetical protein